MLRVAVKIGLSLRGTWSDFLGDRQRRESHEGDEPGNALHREGHTLHREGGDASQ